MFFRELRPNKDGQEHSYWSLVETLRTAEAPRQRTLCYRGEWNTSAQARWQKTIEVFNEQGGSAAEWGSQDIPRTEVEAAFRALKSERAVRPLFPPLERRVQAHLRVALLG